jgi:TonB family protein
LRQLQGDVLLELQINSAGNVQNVRRVSGNALLSEAAERAARQWHYRPFADNQAAPLVTMVSFNFTLKGKANK